MRNTILLPNVEVARTEGEKKIMKTEINTIPVNLQAAKMLWKSPWWAKSPPDERKQIQKAIDPLPISLLIDYTKEMPVRAECPMDQRPKDLKGARIVWTHNGELGRILGFADTVEHHRYEKKKSGQKALRIRREFFWWAVNERGIFVRISAANNGKKSRAWTILPNAGDLARKPAPQDSAP